MSARAWASAIVGTGLIALFAAAAYAVVGGGL